MATIVTPTAPATHESDNSFGVVAGILVAIVLGVLFFLYALPRLQNIGSTGQGTVLPERVDVNVQTPQSTQSPAPAQPPNQPTQ